MYTQSIIYTYYIHQGTNVIGQIFMDLHLKRLSKLADMFDGCFEIDLSQVYITIQYYNTEYSYTKQYRYIVDRRHVQ